MTGHHVVPVVAPPPGGGHSDVADWRWRRLVVAGFDPALARRLATTPGVDLHALLDLVDRGCPPELAARILEPIPGVGA